MKLLKKRKLLEGKVMSKIFLTAIGILIFTQANAQTYGLVVPTCGNQNYPVGNSGQITVLQNGEICDTGGSGGGTSGGTQANPLVTTPQLGTTMNTTPATVTTTAAQILPAATNPVLRQIYNNSTTLTIYIGGSSGITGPTNAFPIPPLSAYDASKFASAVYAISPGGTVTASLIQY